MIKIIVVSDIKIYSEGLSQILSGHEGMDVIDSADNFHLAQSLIKRQHPNVVLLDMTMPNSCKLAQEIIASDQNIKVVGLAVSYDESNILRYAEVGMIGYVPREASINELIDAVLGAAQGECYCPPKIAACILKRVQTLAKSAKNKYLSQNIIMSPDSNTEDSLASFSQEAAKNKESHNESERRGVSPHRYKNAYALLTRRERQIAQLLSDGLSNKQIARDLSIEVSTVKNHVHNLLVKLEVKSRSQAVHSLQQIESGYSRRSSDLDPGLGLTSG